MWAKSSPVQSMAHSDWTETLSGLLVSLPYLAQCKYSESPLLGMFSVLRVSLCQGWEFH